MFRGLNQRLDRTRAAMSRATPAPFLVRCGVALTGLFAMLVAWPASLAASRYLVLLALVALYPAVAPRGRGATFAALVVVGGWIVDTTFYDARIALWRVLAIASLLYIGHSLTALAAVLPYDAVVNLDVVGGWLLRAAGVVLLSALLTVVALGLSANLVGQAFLVATIVGLACAVGATVLIARLLKQP